MTKEQKEFIAALKKLNEQIAKSQKLAEQARQKVFKLIDTYENPRRTS